MIRPFHPPSGPEGLKGISQGCGPVLKTEAEHLYWALFPRKKVGRGQSAFYLRWVKKWRCEPTHPCLSIYLKTIFKQKQKHWKQSEVTISTITKCLLPYLVGIHFQYKSFVFYDFIIGLPKLDDTKDPIMEFEEVSPKYEKFELDRVRLSL